MEGNHKFLHGTIEVTIFHATTYSPPFFFKVSVLFRILCAYPSDSIITLAMKTKRRLLGKITIPANQILIVYEQVRDLETSIPHARGVQLGVLLKKKAEEGVAVRLMLWDDETSLPIIKNKGLMKTNDEDAFAYFKHTKVICRLCPRLHHKFPTLFAHHQKTITSLIIVIFTKPAFRELVLKKAGPESRGTILMRVLLGKLLTTS